VGKLGVHAAHIYKSATHGEGLDDFGLKVTDIDEP